MGSGESLHLTQLEIGGQRVVITTPRYAEGYTLTALGVMITSVYLTNQATRRKLDGRLVRTGQARDVVRKFVFHGGVLTNVLQHHEDAASLDAAIAAITAK